MKLAIATNDRQTIAPHVSRCQAFMIFDIEGTQARLVETRPNPMLTMAQDVATDTGTDTDTAATAATDTEQGGQHHGQHGHGHGHGLDQGHGRHLRGHGHGQHGQHGHHCHQDNQAAGAESPRQEAGQPATAEQGRHHGQQHHHGHHGHHGQHGQHHHGQHQEHGQGGSGHHGALEQALTGCDAVMARGMGAGFWNHIQHMGLKPWIVREQDAGKAAELLAAGQLSTMQPHACCGRHHG